MMYYFLIRAAQLQHTTWWEGTYAASCLVGYRLQRWTKLKVASVVVCQESCPAPIAQERSRMHGIRPRWEVISARWERNILNTDFEEEKGSVPEIDYSILLAIVEPRYTIKFAFQEFAEFYSLGTKKYILQDLLHLTFYNLETPTKLWTGVVLIISHFAPDRKSALPPASNNESALAR